MNAMKINQRDIYETMKSLIQKYASISMIYLNIVYSIPSIFISIMYSIWSEKYSQKIPLILANSGCILVTLVNLFISMFKSNCAIEIFFISNFFLSLFGSTSTMFSIVYNYLLHITTIEHNVLPL